MSAPKRRRVGCVYGVQIPMDHSGPVIRNRISHVERGMTDAVLVPYTQRTSFVRFLRRNAAVIAPVLRSAPLSPQEASRLIAAIAQTSDRQAFATLFNYFFPRVKAYLMRLGTPANVAEELAQETMLRVWRKAAYYAPESGGASTWVFVIARNLRIDRLRGEEPVAPVALDPSDQPNEPLMGESAMLATERDARMREALRSLSDEQAQIVRLFFYEERPHSEIAMLLSIPLGTVKSRVRLAIERLRTQLKDLA
jgi:RNA polymerase sigma-70 factor (ECF subfamily)